MFICNWFILLDNIRSCLAIIRTLREASYAATQKEVKKIIKCQNAVINKDRVAVDPILELASPALVEVGIVSHTLVPERIKWTEDNIIGQYPHPVDIDTDGSGFLYMLDLNTETNDSRVVQLQLHNPVRCKVIKENLPAAQSVCVFNRCVFVATSDGLVFIDPYDQCKFSISGTKAVLKAKIEELCHNPHQDFVRVTDLKDQLKGIISAAQHQYDNQHLRKDLVQLQV